MRLHAGDTAVASTFSLVLITLLFQLSQNFVRPIIALRAVALGASPAVVGLVVAAQGLGGVLVALPTGALMARLGGRLIAAMGGLAFVAGAAAMTLAPSPVWLGIGHFFFGMGGVGAWLAAQTMATIDEDESSARLKIARVSTAALIGQFAGPPIGGALSDLTSVTFAFTASLASALLLFPAAFALPSRGGEGPRGGNADPTADDTPSATISSRLWSRPTLLAVLVLSSLAVGLQTVRQSFLPLHLADAGWSATSIGSTLSLAGVGALASRMAFIPLDRRYSVSQLVALCVFPAALTLGTAVSTYSIAVILASVFVSGFALGLAQPVTLLAMTRVTTRAERGSAVGLRVAGNRLTQAAAPALYGLLAASLGLIGAFWSFAGLCAAAGVVMVRATRQRRIGRESGTA